MCWDSLSTTLILTAERPSSVYSSVDTSVAVLAALITLAIIVLHQLEVLLTT